MKKIFSFLALLLLFGVGTYAQTLTTFSDAGFDASKAYTIGCARAYFMAGDNGMVSTANPTATTVDATSAAQQFAFVTDPYDETVTYLYSVSQGKFLTNSNTWSTSGPSRIYVFTTGNTTYPYALSFSSDYTSKNLMLGGSSQFLLDSWSTLDAGDQLVIEEATTTGYDLTTAQALLKKYVLESVYGAPSGVTYQINGTTVTVGGTGVQSSTQLTADDLTVSGLPTGYTANVSLNGSSYTIIFTYSADVDDLTGKLVTVGDTADFFVEDQWYLLFQKRGTAYAYNSSGTYRMGQAQPATGDITNSDNIKYLFRVIESGTEGQYFIQNADGTLWGGNSTINAAEAGYPYLIYNIASTSKHIGFNQLPGNGKIDNNGNGGTIVTWGTGTITATGGNNDWYIYPVTLEDVTTSSITWNIYGDSEKTELLGTYTKDPVQVGETYTFDKTYSYTTIDTTQTNYKVTSTVAAVTVDLVVTVDGLPFTPSTSYSDAEWYYIYFNANRGNATPTYAADSIPNVVLPNGYTPGDTNAQWAFVGNPVSGYTLYNRGAGASLILATSTGAANDGKTGGNTYAIMTTADNDTVTLNKWFPSDYSAIEGAFTLANEEGVRLNCRSYTSLAHWTGADAGSAFSIVSASLADYTELNEILAYANTVVLGTGLGEYTEATSGTLASAIATAEAFDQETQTSDSYQDAINAAKDALVAAIEALTITQPATGKYYRYKGTNSKHYITAPALGTYALNSTTTAGDGSNIFYLTEDNKILSYYNPGYMYYDSSHFLQLTEPGSEGISYTYTSSNTNAGSYNIADENSLYLYDWSSYSTSNVRVDAEADHSRCQWLIEEVDTLPVTLNEVGAYFYATLYLPVAVEIVGATAYTTTAENDVMVLTEISDGIVPANTAVLLVGNSETANAVITTSSATLTSALSGTIASIATTDVTSPYVFSCVKGVLGFYPFNGTALIGNKAYYSGSAEVAGYTLQWDETDGINALKTDLTTEKIYDLSGRQVTSPRSGLYIKNGKKYMVK